jgi:flagellar biosynthesis protein FliQ
VILLNNWFPGSAWELRNIAKPQAVLIFYSSFILFSMDTQDVIDIGREAIWNMLLIGGPVLAAGMVVGLLIGLLQALTQIQEQTVAFVPKLVAMILVLSLTLPWLIARMVQYSNDLIAGIPGRF